MAPSRAFGSLRQRFALQGLLCRSYISNGSMISTSFAAVHTASYSGSCARGGRLRSAAESWEMPLLSCRQSSMNVTTSSRFQCRKSSSAAAKEAADTIQPPDYLDDKERELFELLTAELSPTSLEVADVSGGCGSMYAVNITSERFRGLSMVKQHRLVNETLGEQLKEWHGLQLRTKVP